MLDLDHARKVIEAEECWRHFTDPSSWCEAHDHFWSTINPTEHCPARSEVADVAAELLEAVERVRKALDPHDDDDRWRDDWERGSNAMSRAVRKALEGDDNA